jgi:long-chain acyl-CoA synthetase
VPYFHIFGALGCITANALAGSTQVLMETFEPEEAMRLIQDERVTVFSGVPTMFITILGHPRFKEFDPTPSTSACPRSAASRPSSRTASWTPPRAACARPARRARCA